jgi:predicted O-methyltransferase YrrM
MSADCLLSVVIPCFNAAATIGRAVQSVMAQGSAGTEIIIVDDRSTDDSVAVAQGLAGQLPALRLVCQDANTGPALARNAGLRLATGRYTCFLDADDEYAPRFVRTVLPLLEKDPSLAWIATGVELVNCHRPVHPAQLDAIANSLPSNIVTRTAAVKMLGGFPADPVFRAETAGEDLVFRSTLGRLFRGSRCPDQCLRYWVKPGSHFDRFLDRTKVINGEVVFAKLTADEASGELQRAGRHYHAQACERLSIFSSLVCPEEACPRLTERFLGTVTAYDELRAAFGAVQGPLHPQEGFALYHLARDGPAGGAVVELGSRYGRSTCWLAAGLRDRGRGKVVAVSPYCGTAEPQEGPAHPGAAVARSATTLPAFMANLQRSGLRNWVDVRIADPVEVGSAWNGPIRFLFIDADDAAEAVHSQVQAWSKHLIPGGILAVYRVGDCPNATRMYQEMFAAGSTWKQIGAVRGLRALRRIAAGNEGLPSRGAAAAPHGPCLRQEP